VFDTQNLDSRELTGKILWNKDLGDDSVHSILVVDSGKVLILRWLASVDCLSRL
jgi:outer membrane protein assembly factor BamB